MNLLQSVFIVGILVAFINTSFGFVFNGGILKRQGEEIVWFKDQQGHTHVIHEEPHKWMDNDSIPESFDWGNVNGKNFLTRMLNQHIPQYCGSCWAHGTASALADRIKIARGGNGIDINLSIQFILNCGKGVAGSCHGGNGLGVYQLIHDKGFIPYDSCQPYEACSSDSTNGVCDQKDYTCSPINVCRTCVPNKTCSAIDIFPNATVKEFGNVTGAENMMAEIYARGPIACSLNAGPLDNYDGGIVDAPEASKETNHIVSIVGWGIAADGTKYWKIRNSWGEYYGHLGFVYLKLGENQLGVEGNCHWATPGHFTVQDHTPCFEDGKNCQGYRVGKYIDPSYKKIPHGESFLNVNTADL